VSSDQDAPTLDEKEFLIGLEREGLRYFLENQSDNGLILDRQRNHGDRYTHGACSTSSTGMGLIALGLASSPHFRMLSESDALTRARHALRTALMQLPHDHGIVPHFIHSASGHVQGSDARSTIDSAWLAAGGLWAAAWFGDAELSDLATEFYERIDWGYWSTAANGEPAPLRHGKCGEGHFLGSTWDRVNGETIFMYVLAAGAAAEKALGTESWQALRPFYGSVAGHYFNNADLGLFVFQYGLDLLDMHRWRHPAWGDLWQEARTATAANLRSCRLASDRFQTYRRFWGLSAGDGPPDDGPEDIYRCYSPSSQVDGTAHVSATAAAVAHNLGAVLKNLSDAQAERNLTVRGRYGFSNVNVDRAWVSRDMIGIDAGALVLAIDNYLTEGRVRSVFHSIEIVERGLERLGFTTRQGESERHFQLAASRLAS
jgi:hypothetical protein